MREQQAQGQTCLIFLFILFVLFFLTFSLQLDIQQVKRSSNRCNVYTFCIAKSVATNFQCIDFIQSFALHKWHIQYVVCVVSSACIIVCLHHCSVANHYNADPFLTIAYDGIHARQIGWAALFQPLKSFGRNWLHFIKLACDCG